MKHLRLILSLMAAFFCFHFAQALEQDADGYYLIHNAQELVEFRDSVNNDENYNVYNARLAADIDLSSVCGIIDGKEVNWIPMKVNNFDGANHTISNLYINSNENYQALLNPVYDAASISNLIVDKAFVKGKDGVAGIALSGTLQNCHFNGVVVGNDDVYGFTAIGKCCSYINCSNYGLIIAKKNAAGIAPGGYVYNCYNQGRVVSFGEYAGGIVNLSSDYPIANCYNSGRIIA